jgi:hypothetical protein
MLLSQNLRQLNLALIRPSGQFSSLLKVRLSDERSILKVADDAL